MFKDTKHLSYGKAQSNHPHLLNADTKLLENVFAKLYEGYRFSFERMFFESSLRNLPGIGNKELS